jgi:hypothetical protein
MGLHYEIIRRTIARYIQLTNNMGRGAKQIMDTLTLTEALIELSRKYRDGEATLEQTIQIEGLLYELHNIWKGKQNK